MGRTSPERPCTCALAPASGYLPQEASVFRKLSAEDNLRAILELRRDLDRPSQAQLLEQLLDEFNLRAVRKSLGERLSGGERRRVEIARALASNPRFMLLDEPFAGVDPISVSDIKQEMRDLAARDIGVLVTDHNVRDTLDICDRAYIVNAGHIIAGRRRRGDSRQRHRPQCLSGRGIPLVRVRCPPARP